MPKFIRAHLFAAAHSRSRRARLTRPCDPSYTEAPRQAERSGPNRGTRRCDVMLHPFILTTLAVALATGSGHDENRRRTAGSEPRDPLTLERVARYPPPGTAVATTFRFGHDGRYLYFLGVDGEGIARSL